MPVRGSARFPLLLKLLFTLCVGVTALATVALVVATVELTRSNRDVEHTLHIQQALETLKLSLVNAETGQRGFLLTGETHFLEPYIDAVAHQAYILGQLERLTADNPAQVREVEAVKGMADDALRQMSRVLNQHPTGSAQADALGEGKMLMDKVRVAIDGMRNEQDRMLATRQAEVDKRTRYGIAVLLVSDAASLLGLALLYVGAAAHHRRRLRVEFAAEQREREVRELFEQAPVGQAECELDTARILRANERLADLTGYSRDELRRTSLIDLLPRANRLDNARAYRELCAGGHDLVTWEQPMQCKSGEPRWVAVRLSPVRDAGKVERTAVAVEDIGVRKRSEDALVGSESLLRAFVEDTRHIAFAKDRNGSYTFVNGAFAAAVERDRSDILGKRDEDLFPPRCAGQLHRIDERIIDSRAPDSFEQAFEFPTETRTYLVSEAPFHSEHGEIVGVVAVGTDVTERKAEEERREARLAAATRRAEDPSAEIIEAVERERARLALELHDELGASMSAIWVELVGMLAGLKADAPQLLRRHERALAALTGTSQKLRRITSGLHPEAIERLGLAAALSSYVSGWSLTAGTRADLHVDDPLPQLTRDQELTVYRITQEALTNIEKHAHADRVQVTLTAMRDALHLRITDDGIGIPDTALAGDDTLGLRGMRERAARVGGTCSVTRRNPSGGTSVVARIPVADVPSASRDDERTAPRNLS